MACVERVTVSECFIIYLVKRAADLLMLRGYEDSETHRNKPKNL